MRTFLIEIIFSDGSCKYTNVGAQWHDVFLKSLKNKRAVLVRAWSSSQGVIKKCVVNRKKYAEFLKTLKNAPIPSDDEQVQVESQSVEEVSDTGDSE